MLLMMMKSENIILIGMAGAGKSTLGVLLAKALGMDFVDTDILIQQSTKKLLQEIIETEGVERFMEIEEEVLSTLSLQNTVIATGGSAVYSDKAMKALKENGKAVYLRVGYDDLIRRIRNITTRGIVFRNATDFRSVYEERLPLYEKYADITIDTTTQDIEASVRLIVEAVK